MATSSVSSQPAKKVIVFDFDQTLTCNHVFKLLAGWTSDPNCPPDLGATTEIGQLKRIQELEAIDPNVITSWFGGSERVEGLRNFFGELRQNSCELYVCSKGLIGPVRAALERVQLLEEFTDVHAVVDTYGISPFDQRVLDSGWTPSEEGWDKHMNRTENAEWARSKRGKAWLCINLAGPRPAMLVEDDPEEITKAETKGLATCYVEDRRGVGHTEMDEMLAWAQQGTHPRRRMIPPTPKKSHRPGWTRMFGRLGCIY